MRVDVVCTTIGVAAAFFDAYEDLLEHEGKYEVRLVVIPDKKTPAEFYDRAVRAARKIRVLAPNPDLQEEFLHGLKADHLIPWNSDNRRNVGYLMALRDGADMIISVDDDNLPTMRSSFIEAHACVTEPAATGVEVVSHTGWFNPCDLINIECWPRGFPYYARRAANVTWRPLPEGEQPRVTVNAGLWRGEPDVDAITRLAMQPKAYTLSWSVITSRDTWAPVNSQNTAVARDALPAYYFANVDRMYGGRPSGRFGDIFQGYFVQACAKHLGHAIRFGTPLADHDRNHHDVMRDLEMELPWIRILERLLPELKTAELGGTNYEETYGSLAEWLGRVVSAGSRYTAGWDVWDIGSIASIASRMKTWLDVCRRINGG